MILPSFDWHRLSFCSALFVGLLLVFATSAASSAQPPAGAGKNSHGHAKKTPGNPHKAYLNHEPLKQGHFQPQRNAQLIIVPYGLNHPNLAPGFLRGDGFGFSPGFDYGISPSMFMEFDSPRVWDYGSVYTPYHSYPGDQAQPANPDQFHQALRPAIVSTTPRASNPRLSNSPNLPTAYPTIHTKASARSAQHRAEIAFRNGDYPLAASLARQVVTLDADNGIALLFASHASFANRDFDQAAKDLRVAIDLLPAEQWDFVVKNYRHFYGQNDYVRQMEQLNNFLIDRPLYLPALIVRGHQWGSLGHLNSAYEDFSLALSKRSSDETILKLLERYNPTGVINPRANFIQQPAPWLSEPPTLMQAVEQPPEAANEGLFEAPSFAPGQPVETLPTPDDNDSLENLDEFQLPEWQN